MPAMVTELSGLAYEILGGYRESAVRRALDDAKVPANKRDRMLATLHSYGPSVRGWLDSWSEPNATSGDRRSDGQIRQALSANLDRTTIDNLLKRLQLRQNVATSLTAGALLLGAGIIAACL